MMTKLNHAKRNGLLRWWGIILMDIDDSLAIDKIKFVVVLILHHNKLCFAPGADAILYWLFQWRRGDVPRQ